MPELNAGAYLSWELHKEPGVLVGMDGRYRVAYQDGVVEQLIDMFRGAADWRRTLERYPTDIVLVSRSRPLARLMEQETDWTLVYRDDTYDMYARPSLSLPIVDRTGQAFNVDSNTMLGMAERR
jgi:hypothetical protein